MIILCPVCQSKMSTINNSISFKCITNHNHATIYVNEFGKQTIRIIEVGSYIFEIHDDENIKRTRITKLMEPGKGKRRMHYLSTFERQTLLVVPSVINAPWHDTQQVEEKIKLYMWFT
jgi:hypothetical protein